METKQHILPEQRKIINKFNSNILGPIFPESDGIGTLPEQMYHCFRTYSTKRTVNAYVNFKPKKIMFCRIISMYNFKRNFSYFICKEVFVRKVPNIPPIQVVNKVRPVGKNIRYAGDISLE